MKTRRVLIVLTALMLAAVLGASAVSDGNLKQLYNTGTALLFDTNNVTVNGTVTFSCDGERFKTVKGYYAQDGFNSIWRYQLFTPRKNAPGDRETGYTVIGNGYSVYVMETMTPGYYREGVTQQQRTLVRRSPQLDQVVRLAELAVGQMEPLLGADAVNVLADNDAGRKVTVTLEEKDVSELTDILFNLGVQTAIERLFARGLYDWDGDLQDDGTVGHMTVTDMIVCTTERYALNGLSLTFTTDGAGHLRGVTGDIAVKLHMLDKSEHDLDIHVDLTAYDYGNTRVNAFDPEEYGVRPYYEAFMDFEGQEAFIDFEDQEAYMDFEEQP